MKIRSIFFIIFMFGIVQFFYSFTLPYYKNDIQKKDLDLEFCKVNHCNSVNECYYNKDYNEKLSKLLTNRNFFMDIGLGVAIYSLVILVFLIFNNIYEWKDFYDVYSFERSKIIILSNIVWLLMIPCLDGITHLLK